MGRDAPGVNAISLSIRKQSGTNTVAVVDRVLARGPHKAAVRLLRGPQVDLMIMPPGEAGTYLIHFTGSKEHNVRLRERARDLGWSLSEYGFARLGEDGQPVAILSSRDIIAYQIARSREMKQAAEQIAAAAGLL